MSLIIEWNASTNLFYLLKNLLLLTIVIFKLKCCNLIFNEIMILNASYVCLHAFSLCRESPDLDPKRRTPHFWGGSITSRLPPWHHLLRWVIAGRSESAGGAAPNRGIKSLVWVCWAERLLWAEGTVDRAPLNSVVYYFPSALFKSRSNFGNL
jgi:hypothetical protein